MALQFKFNLKGCRSVSAPNKACTRQVGFCAFLEHFSGFEFFLHLKQSPRPPTCG